MRHTEAPAAASRDSSMNGNALVVASTPRMMSGWPNQQRLYRSSVGALEACDFRARQSELGQNRVDSCGSEILCIRARSSNAIGRSAAAAIVVLIRASKLPRTLSRLLRRVIGSPPFEPVEVFWPRLYTVRRRLPEAQQCRVSVGTIAARCFSRCWP
jgi:hypothetical protein